MFDGLVIHETSLVQLKGMAGDLPHGLILTGKPGVGLRTIATELAHLGAGKQGSVITIEPDEKGLISISSIKELYASTRSKLTSNKVVIIDNADSMSLDAQNAFLKLLEEPVSGIHFLLTSHVPELLLATINSRLQHVLIQPINKHQMDDLIAGSGNLSATEKAQAAFIAEGLPAEIKRINDDENYKKSVFDLAATAKSMLTASQYQKLIICDKLSSDRNLSLHAVEIMARMLRMQLKSRQDDQLLDYVNTLTDVYEHLQKNAHVRTQLLRLCI